MQEELNIQYWVERVSLFNDELAFEKLFMHFNADLYQLAFSFVRSKGTAEEIISDTFVNLWRNRSKLSEIDNLKVYLYVSVKNLSIRHLSRNKPDAALSLDELLAHTVSATGSSPEELLISKEMNRIFQAAVDQLPPKCRLIFRLAREDGFKYKEISRILNISVKTIDAQMAIAAKRVAQSIRFLLK